MYFFIANNQPLEIFTFLCYKSHRMKKLTTTIFCLLSTLLSYASHLNGGELRYEYVGGNTYRVYLDIYSDCGGIGSPSSETVMVSGPSSYTATLTLPKTSTDTVQPYCPGTITRCVNVTSSIPGYFRCHYSTLITLPTTPTGTYTFAYTASARNTATNTTGGNLYLEATLNNALGTNNTAWIPNVPAMYLANNVLTAVPLHGVDAEGDSLVYTLIAPKTSATTNCTYNSGYSVTNPFGTSGVCNFSGMMLNVKGVTLGNFSLSFIVSEYRGGTLVGKMHRDFVFAVLPSTGGGYTTPAPTTTTTLQSTTCPGSSNSLTLNFNDPTSTDSVYVTLTPPTISGWSFTTTSAPGIGSGAATITWTTPTSASPSTTPYFYINIFVRDNGCMNRAMANFAHLVRLVPCVVISDSVWPGDANKDKTVNLLDPLAIAVAYGKTGAARSGATLAWTAQACAPWADTFITGVNMKHADCNGNGTVNLSDLTAVVSNFGLTHPKSTGGANKTTGAPELKFDHAGITFSPGKTVTVPLKLGDANSMMNNLYGLAANIIIDGVNLATAPTFSYTTSWLGSISTTLTFNKNISNNNVAWAYARINQTTISGQGTIATMTFTIPAGTPIGTKIVLKLENDVMIDQNGKPITTAYNVVNDTISVIPTTIETAIPTALAAYVIPNPSADNASLYIAAENAGNVQIHVLDITGKTVWQQTTFVNKGSQYIQLPADQLSSGAYTICMISDAKDTKVSVKWMKQ